MRRVAVGLGLLALLAPSAAAQFQVTASRDLVFGWVIPGIDKSIAANDPVRSATFEIQATVGDRVGVRFTLPNHLINAAGQKLKANFANGDALALETGSGAVPVAFNPSSQRNFTLTTGNRLLLFLGGTAQPRKNQQPGVYRNTVTLTVTIM